MKPHAYRWLVLGGLLATALTRADAAEDEPLRVTLALKEGSRIIGTLAQEKLPIDSDVLGVLDLPLARVRRMSLPNTGNTHAIRLSNGDTLRGKVRQTEFDLSTAFGRALSAAEIAALAELDMPAL